MIGHPYRFRSKRTHIVRDWLLLVAAGLIIGTILFYSIT